MLFKFILTNILIFSSTYSAAQEYVTVPKGVRLFLARHVQTNIKSNFNQSQSESPFTFQAELDVKTLEAINNDAVQSTLATLSAFPSAYSQLNLGTHRIEAEADVKVDAYAFGYGITNKIMAYAAIPVYDTRVSINYKKIKNDTISQVAETLQGTTDSDTAQAIGDALENISGPNGSTIQNIIVNGLGYKEIGNWSGQGLGDIEFGLAYNFFTKDNYGFKATLGGVAPTGYVDDVDIIQDVGFGDGQWDAFAEIGAGYVYSKSLILNTALRYTYQFESEKDLRIPFGEDVSLGNTKDKFTEKLGNKISLETSVELAITDWFDLKPSYIYTQTEKAQYSSANSEANKLLAANTDSSSHTIKLLGILSSVKLYQQQKFLLPAQIRGSFQKVFRGKNTPRADRFELEFRMFF